jgi:hypothetical protein
MEIRTTRGRCTLKKTQNRNCHSKMPAPAGANMAEEKTMFFAI